MNAFVVTGATGALGRAVSEALLAAGARVAVPYRDAGRFEALRAASLDPDRLWGAAADITDAEATRRFVDAARERLGGLSGAALVAGGYRGGASLEASPPGEWEEMLRTNLATAYACCRALLPHLRARGGSVVSVGSRLVEQGGAGSAAYAVSKAGLQALMRALAAENRDRGVRFNLVAPAVIDTAANRSAMPDADRSRWTPVQRVASVIAYLLSPDSAPITGAVIPVEGGAL
jgi:NAD(P)-dependent dehydrogenase (short-subunit alcohol dehydrogenase family)